MSSTPKAHEINFDGLVGPTHSYAGLSFGNVASTSHRALVSNPREAALQGLRKMKALVDLGFKQALLPPQERPDLNLLKQLGYSGNDGEILAAAAKDSPEILAACSSASSMWTANAATIAPSADSSDGRVHFTPANLISKFHRAIEPPTTGRILKSIFKADRYFAHHEPLPPHLTLGDEGAANHSRFCGEYGQPGVHFYVFGRSAFHSEKFPEPKIFPARQTLEASQAVARQHGLDPGSVVFAQQNPDAIDAGAFHNDVVAVANRDLLFYHEQAYRDSEQVTAELSRKLHAVCGIPLRTLCVPAQEVSLSDAVKSYLFNSQLLSLDSGQMILIAPEECKNNSAVNHFILNLQASSRSPFKEVLYFDLKQSMRNGGGPACLRLRVVLTPDQILNCAPGVFLGDHNYAILCDWVTRHYRDRLTAEDLRDPRLRSENCSALDELTQILGLGSIYPFQL